MHVPLYVYIHMRIPLLCMFHLVLLILSNLLIMSHSNSEERLHPLRNVLQQQPPWAETRLLKRNLVSYKILGDSQLLTATPHVTHYTGQRGRSNSMISTFFRRKRSTPLETPPSREEQHKTFSIEQIFQTFSQLPITNQRDSLAKYIVSYRV